MSGSARAHELGRSRCARTAAAVLLVALWTLPAGAQEASLDTLLKKVLPAPMTGEVLPTPPTPERHIIPVSPPIKDQDINVEENDGLISLSVRNASLRQVVALVADTQKLNLVFAAPEDVAVTATFDQVPWQQALDSLLSATNHTWTDNGGIIFVTSSSVAAAVAPQAGGRQVHVFELDFASAVDIDQTVQGLLSPAGKSWILESSAEDNRRNREAVAVVDYPANLAQIADYVCQADQPPRQVLIQAHILKVELDDECRNGVDFEQLTASFSGNQIRFLTAGFAGEPGPTTTASFLDIDGAALDSMVEILQTTLDAKTLASPKVLAVSGQQSKLQIGEKIGYRETTTTQTSSLESVKFLDVGVVLTVTPRVTRDGRVLMRVKPEVSTGQLNPVTDLPNSETTHVETDILLEDGHGMVIGGLIQEEDRNSQTKLPWLGDIPYAGVLFQRRTVEKARTEIIVTLIPHVLPYTPMLAHRNAHEFMRTDQPLTYGAIHRFPRPYEPRMPDTFTNPRTLCEDIQTMPPLCPESRMVRLPPVNGTPEACPVEYDVTEAKPAAEPPVDVEMARLPSTYR